MIFFTLRKQEAHGEEHREDLRDRDGVPDAVDVKDQRQDEHGGCLEHERAQERDRG